MPPSTTAMRAFIQAEHFAVIGRVLADRNRFDNKVLRWYQNQHLPVTPIRPADTRPGAPEPSSDAIEGLQPLTEAAQLNDIASTSISIIISPTQGLPILQSLFRPGAKHPRAVWFQPGAESDEIRKFVKDENLEDRIILGGPCILVLGSGLMSERKQSKL